MVFITIHLDDNRDKWLKDLETHAVPWYCLTDLKAWKSPVAKAYNIAGVPDCFIIGKDGLSRRRSCAGKRLRNSWKSYWLPAKEFNSGPVVFRMLYKRLKRRVN